MSEGNAERRKYQRINTEVQVNIQKYDVGVKNLFIENGLSKNLSVGGILIQQEKPLEIPSYIIVSFSLPDSNEKLDFVGKAIRIEELSDGSYEIGIMFMKMIIGEFKEVLKFVEKELKD